MNRRLFLNSLLGAGIGGTVAYSFPSIIVPKNIVPAGIPIFGPLNTGVVGYGAVISELEPVAYWPCNLSNDMLVYVNGVLTNMREVASQAPEFSIPPNRVPINDNWYHIVAVRG